MKRRTLIGARWRQGIGMAANDQPVSNVFTEKGDFDHL